MKPTWEAEGVEMYLGDALVVIPSVAFDSMATDPPYGTQAMGNGYGRSHETIANDRESTVVADAAQLAFSALPPNSCAIAFCSARRRRESEGDWLNAGFSLLGEVVWDKGAPDLGWRIRYSHETALVFEKGTLPVPSRALISVLRYPRPSAKVRHHPTEKPVELMADLVSFAAADGKVVCDPFMGAGTTGVACVRTGRKFVGIELDPAYFAIAVSRIEKAFRERTESNALFGAHPQEA